MSVARQETAINRRFSLWSKLNQRIDCPGCHCCQNCIANRCRCRAVLRVLFVLKTVFAFASATLALIIYSEKLDDIYANTSFSSNDTRLVVISSFFNKQAEITVNEDDQFSANATLYLVNQPPPLTAKFQVYQSTIVKEWLPDQFFWHYYLHPNSNVTMQACRWCDQEVRQPCHPFFLFIIKGLQNFKNWKSSPNVENAGEERDLITKCCSEGMQQFNYTTKEDDNYYFFPYTEAFCPDKNTRDDSGTVDLIIEKLEYSVSGIKADGVCNTYVVPSCSLSVPLRAGYERELIAVQGLGNQTYSISFSSSNRTWAFCVVIIPPGLLLAISSFMIGCFCYKLRRRRNYSSLQ